jgi:hypothetical protein
MRPIKNHIINPANDLIDISAIDEPGAGGANHLYRVAWGDGQSGDSTLIRFQNGPIAENGVNGLTQEVLLAVVIDRLRSFQSGPFSCRENAIAMTKCEEALHWLQHRTLDRMRRGVEGKTAA